MKNKLFYFFVLVGLLLCLPACDISSVKNNEKTQYDINNDCFSLVDFDILTFTDVNLGTGSSRKSHGIKFISKCEIPLTEYSMEIWVYSSSNKLLLNETIDNSAIIEANKTFETTLRMSDNVYDSTKTIKIVYSGKSHQQPSENARGNPKVIELCTVNFYDENHLLAKTTVKSGDTVDEWSAPRKNNYIFLKWCEDSSKTQEFDFSQKITQDTKLYASYTLDAVTINNKINSDTIKSVVTVHNKSYNKNFWGKEKDVQTSVGSGIILNINGEYCYILTNYHLAKKLEDRSYQTITIEDYAGRQYTGTLYQNPNKNVAAISQNYDLALLYIKISSSSNLQILPYSTDPQTGDDIIAIGWHNGQKNAIVYGNVLPYEPPHNLPSNSKSNVTFNVINHNSIITGLSSGGPILNSDLVLVGLHFGNSQSSKEGFAIPVSKILDFWELYIG